MDLARFLSAADAQRAARTLDKLRRHGISALALTGGFAIELQFIAHGPPAQIRPLNDIDFLVASFEAIPPTLGADFLFRHVHPNDPPGKTLLQAIDPETSVRVDIFRAYGAEMERGQHIDFAGGFMRTVAPADLIARAARLCLDLASGKPTPAKHTRDFLRLLPLAGSGIERVWREHRKPSHPNTFAEAVQLLTALIAERSDLQIAVEYSRDTHRQCPRCEATPSFPLADPARVLEILGYC